MNNNQSADAARERRRHLRAYRFFYRPCRLLFRLLFGYRSSPVVLPDGPCLILSNHCTDFDPILVGCSFPKQMYFVAGEHVFRKGLLSRFLQRYFAPIQRIKGSTDSSSAFAILRALRNGSNVCLFAEGEKTYTGRTLPIHPTTARLAIASGATLVTFRTEGGYFTSPRWGFGIRQGRMSGQVINIYSPQQMKKLGKDGLHQAISSDLFTDAYQQQREQPIPFRGKRLAERLELALCLCPRCGQIDTLTSHRNSFSCECGLSMTLDEYGSFHGKELPFANPQEWDDWQELELKARQLKDKAAFSDVGQILFLQNPDHSLSELSRGRMALYSDHFELGELSIPLSHFSDMALTQRDGIVFTADGQHYVVKSDHLRNGRKYVTLFKYLRLRLQSGNEK